MPQVPPKPERDRRSEDAWGVALRVVKSTVSAYGPPPVDVAREALTVMGQSLGDSKYYWLNEGNRVEWGGPFGTVAEAVADCERVYRNIADSATYVAVLRVVKDGSVTTRADFKWQDRATPPADKITRG